MNLNDVPVFATLPIAAKLLMLSERKVWQMGKDGLIRVVRIGGSVRYCIREFLERSMTDEAQHQH